MVDYSNDNGKKVLLKNIIYLLIGVFIMAFCKMSVKDINTYVFGILFIISICLMLIGFINLINYSKRKNALKESSILENGETIKSVIDSINKNTVFEDSSISIGEKYFIIKSNYKIIKLESVLAVYKYVHKTNGIEDGLYIIVVDNYGNKIKIAYTKRLIETAINELDIACPNAMLGYNSKTLKWIEENKIKKQ